MTTKTTRRPKGLSREARIKDAKPVMQNMSDLSKVEQAGLERQSSTRHEPFRDIVKRTQEIQRQLGCEDYVAEAIAIKHLDLVKQYGYWDIVEIMEAELKRQKEAKR